MPNRLLSSYNERLLYSSKQLLAVLGGKDCKGADLCHRSKGGRYGSFSRKQTGVQMRAIAQSIDFLALAVD